METIVTKSYQGAQTRLLLPKIKDVAGVIGDNNSTRLVFKLPKNYENWDKFIEFDCYVTREDMEIKPTYALDENNSFLIPYEITESNVGKEVDYNLKFVTNNGEIVEKSEIGTLYFRDSSNGEFTEVDPQVDILTYLYDNAFCNVTYKDGSTEGDQSLPALTFTPMNPNVQSEEITLNVPYLQNGVIPNRFIDKEIVIEVFKITTPDALTSLDAQVPDMALVIDPNSLYYNNLYILVNNDPTVAGNWYLAHTDNPVFSNIEVNGNADITALTTESLTIDDDNLKSKILVTDANGTVTTDSSLDLSELHALDGITGNIQNQINSLDTKIDTEIQDRIDDVDAEESRATAAETQLNTAITDESNRATQAESTLQSNIDDVSDALDQEILDRQSADTNLSNTKRNKIITQHTDYPMAYTQSVSGEETQQKIIDSFTDAQQQQTISIGGSLVARQNDGTIVSSTPQNDYEVTTKAYVDEAVSSEASARQSADATLQSNIDAEETRAKGIESGLRADLTAETTARTSADTTLTNNLASEVSTRTSEITRIEGLISTEASERQSADDTLQDNIDIVSAGLTQEISDRQTAVSGEASARQSADNVLDGKITVEKTAREQADSTLTTAISNEVTRATGVENGLNTRVSTIEGVIPSGTDTDNKLVNESFVDDTESRLQSDIADVQSALDTHIADTSNPHNVTQAQVGLGNVNNTSDLDKPISTATQTALNGKVDKTFNNSVFVGASITERTNSGAKLTFDKKSTVDNQTGTVSVTLPIATGGSNGLVGLATPDQINQIAQNREDIDLLLGKSTRYAIDVDLTGMTDAQIQTALTSAWRTASGQTTGDPAQYTTLVNLWNNHEFTWLTVSQTTKWEDRGISTVSIATDSSLGVVMGTADPGNGTSDGSIYVDENGQMQVIGWDGVTTDIANAQSDITGLQNNKVDKLTTSPAGIGFVKVNVNAQGQVIGNSAMVENDIPALSISKITGLQTALDNKLDDSQLKTSWSSTVSNSNIPSEKLVKDTLDAKYIKPSTGIPKTDLATAVQTSLSKADTSVQKTSNQMKLYGTDSNGAEKEYTVAPSNEYPASTSTDDEIPTSLAVYTVVSEKYAKPQGGIPKSDLASAVQTSLDKADTALQSHQSTKTINNTSLVGTGNINLQVPLVGSGTGQNIKTVGGTNILGSGNIPFPTVTNGNPSLTWDTKSTVGSVGSTNLEVTMPSNPVTKTKIESVLGVSATYNDKALIVQNGVLAFGEAGKVDDVKVNNVSVVSNKTANVTVPTKVSDLQNDTGFITGLGFDDLSSHPTTLSGYGITDAVPNSRTINGATLSSNITLDGADIILTGYSKPSSSSAVDATDTINDAIGKLEKGMEGYLPLSGGTLTGSLTLTGTNGITSNNIIFNDWKLGVARNASGKLYRYVGLDTNSTTGWLKTRAEADVITDLGIDLKAPLASPALTGTPTAPTATAGTNTTQIATTAFVKTAIDNIPFVVGNIFQLTEVD